MDAEPSQDENVNTLLSSDDKHIIQYLSGAIIKWEVKNFLDQKRNGVKHKFLTIKILKTLDFAQLIET